MPVIEKLKGYLRETILIRQNKNQCTGGRSLLCNNCTGGVILHELGLRFDTPTINTWIPDEDFLRFAENIAFYKKQQLKILPNQKDYVLACLGDVHVHFMHETDPERRFVTGTEEFPGWTKRIYIAFLLLTRILQMKLFRQSHNFRCRMYVFLQRRNTHLPSKMFTDCPTKGQGSLAEH